MKKPKCKVCKNEFNKIRLLQNVCSFDCAIILARKNTEKNLKNLKKESNKEIKVRKIVVYEKENKKYLQDEINKLARQIDLKFYNCCIDCGILFKAEMQQHGAHFHDVGGHNSIRYNLHNIHSAASQCNKYSSSHKTGYKIGLIERYGEDYFNMVYELNSKYPYIKLSAKDVYDKLKIVRKLNRDFLTFNFETPVEARNVLNKIIGIYEV